MATEQAEDIPLTSSEEEEEGEGEPKIETWDDWESEDEESPSEDYLCLFCDSRFGSSGDLFEHCASDHSFDFRGIVADAGLDFYGSIKLINYVRAQLHGELSIMGRAIALGEEDDKETRDTPSLSDTLIPFE